MTGPEATKFPVAENCIVREKLLADDNRTVPNRMTTVSSPKTKAKGQVHKYSVDMVKGVLFGLGNKDYL